MKCFIAATFSCLLASQVCVASEPLPATPAKLASKSLLLDIANVDQSLLVAVGERGHILLSTDAISWQQANVPSQSTLTAVTFINETLGWAVGHDAIILHTRDGGLNWEIQQYIPEREKPLLDVMFRDEHNGIAVGAYGQFFRTIDGGKNWQEVFHDEFLPPGDVEYLNDLKMEDELAYLDERSSILPHFNRLVMDGRTLYLAGEIGLIAKSNDEGETWEPFTNIYQGSFYDIERTQEGNLLVVGLRGHIFRSLRNGTPWQPITSKTTALLNDIVLSNDNRIFILGNNGLLLESLDDGQSFSLKNQDDGKALIAGTWFRDQLIVVSEVGIKTITMTK